MQYQKINVGRIIQFLSTKLAKCNNCPAAPLHTPVNAVNFTARYGKVDQKGNGCTKRGIGCMAEPRHLGLGMT